MLLDFGCKFEYLVIEIVDCCIVVVVIVLEDIVDCGIVVGMMVLEDTVDTVSLLVVDGMEVDKMVELAAGMVDSYTVMEGDGFD